MNLSIEFFETQFRRQIPSGDFKLNPFVSLEEIRMLFPAARPFLGQRLRFWEWLLDAWKDEGGPT